MIQITLTLTYYIDNHTQKHNLLIPYVKHIQQLENINKMTLSPNKLRNLLSMFHKRNNNARLSKKTNYIYNTTNLCIMENEHLID